MGRWAARAAVHGAACSSRGASRVARMHLLVAAAELEVHRPAGGVEPWHEGTMQLRSQGTRRMTTDQRGRLRSTRRQPAPLWRAAERVDIMCVVWSHSARSCCAAPPRCGPPCLRTSPPVYMHALIFVYNEQPCMA
eukprot:COSAG01_NODE_868_length_13035_cov_4.786024_13_plen_136_part_00